MKKIIRELRLNKIGLFELLIAVFPILLPFLIVHLSVLLFLVLMAMSKTKQRTRFKPYTALVVYVFLHEFLLIFTMGSVESYFLNHLLQDMIYLISVMFIIPAVNVDRFEGAVNFVSIICIAGMIYQSVIVFSGGTVAPLIFLFGGGGEEFVAKGLIRPMSFFIEPSNYVAYMVVPMFLALLRKNYVFVTIIIVSIFLSTSTTGLATSFIIPFVYVLTEKEGIKNRFAIVALIGFMVMALVSLTIFDAILDKAENVDVETNVRLAQGPKVFEAMPKEDCILGCNYANPYDYYMSGALGGVDVIAYGENLYLPTFWYFIVKYGFIGLFLYIYCYVSIARKNRKLIPFVVCAIIVMFTAGKSLSGFFVFEIIFLLSMVYHQKSEVINQRIRV